MINWLLILPLSQQTPGLLDRASLEGFDLNEQGLDCNTDFSVLDLSLARIVRNNLGGLYDVFDQELTTAGIVYIPCSRVASRCIVLGSMSGSARRVSN